MRFVENPDYVDFGNESDSKPVNKTEEGDGHTMYVKVVMTDILQYVDSDIHLETMNPRIEDAAKTYFRISHYLKKVIVKILCKIFQEYST